MVLCLRGLAANILIFSSGFPPPHASILGLVTEMTSLLHTSRALPGVRLGCESWPHSRQAGLTLDCFFTSSETGFSSKMGRDRICFWELGWACILELSIQVQPGSLDGNHMKAANSGAGGLCGEKRKTLSGCEMAVIGGVWKAEKRLGIWGLLRRGGVSSGNPCLDRTPILTGSSAPAPLHFRWNGREREEREAHGLAGGASSLARLEGEGAGGLGRQMPSALGGTFKSLCGRRAGRLQRSPASWAASRRQPGLPILGTRPWGACRLVSRTPLCGSLLSISFSILSVLFPPLSLSLSLPCSFSFCPNVVSLSLCIFLPFLSHSSFLDLFMSVIFLSPSFSFSLFLAFLFVCLFQSLPSFCVLQEFGQAPGAGDGQGSLWAAVHGVKKSDWSDWLMKVLRTISSNSKQYIITFLLCISW